MWEITTMAVPLALELAPIKQRPALSGIAYHMMAALLTCLPEPLPLIRAMSWFAGSSDSRRHPRGPDPGPRSARRSYPVLPGRDGSPHT